MSELYSEYEAKEEGYYASERRELDPFVPTRIGRALDVGCGDGRFGGWVKESRGAEVWGVEFYRPAAEQAMSTLDHVICAPFGPTLDLPGAAFDVIFFNDVLEHLADPYSAVCFARTLLSPGGVVVASLPNMRYFPVMRDLLLKKDWRYANSGIMDRTHLRFFTRRSMVALFEEQGFRVDRIEGIRPAQSWKFRLVNLLLLNSTEDMLYPQYAIVATPSNR